MSSLDRAISVIYETVGAPQRWPAALEEVTRAIGANSAALLTREYVEDEGGVWFLHNIDQSAQRHYQDYYYQKDTLFQEAKRHGWFDGRTITDDEVLPRDVFVRHEFFNDFWRSFEGEYQISGGAPARWGGFAPLVQFMNYRTRAQGRFDREVRLKFETLKGHVFQSLFINNQIAAAINQISARNLLEFLRDPALIVDHDLRVVETNALANAILRDGTFLRCKSHTLVRTPASVGLHATLTKLLNEGPDALPQTIATRDPDGTRVCVYNVMRVLPQWPGEGLSNRVLITLRTQDHRDKVAWHAMKRLYGLTEAELQVCRLMSDGHSLGEIAQMSGRSVETVRTHAKRIMQKTGCRRQTELAQLVHVTFALPGLPFA